MSEPISTVKMSTREIAEQLAASFTTRPSDVWFAVATAQLDLALLSYRTTLLRELAEEAEREAQSPKARVLNPKFNIRELNAIAAWLRARAEEKKS